MYCAYAFGIPIILGIIALLLNNLELIPNDFRNQIGKKSCVIGGSSLIEFIYVYCPVIITILINIIFYSITAYEIYKSMNATNFKGGESKRHSNEVDKMRFGNNANF